MDRYLPNSVRDRRSVTRFDTDRRVMTDWSSILLAEGTALYCFYVSLSAIGQQVPGLRRIAARFGISAQYIGYYNRVLVWSGLVDVEPGRDGLTNTYSLLDVPDVTLELLGEIKRDAINDDVMGAAYAESFRKRLIERLDGWRPWQPVLVVPEAYRPYIAAVNGRGPDPEAAALPDTVLDRLIALSFRADKAAALIDAHGEQNIAGWLAWIDHRLVTEPTYFKRGPSGYLLSVAGQVPPAVPELLGPDQRRCKRCDQVNGNATYCDDCLDQLGVSR